jgi:hypothetical protein
MRGRARRVSVGACVVLATSGCGTLLGYDDLAPWPPEGGMAGDAEIATDAAWSGDSRAPTGCPVIQVAEPCQKIPPMPKPEDQKVDGVGTEFCAIPAYEFYVLSAPATIPSTLPSPPPDLREKVELRVAWSDAAFHLHIHVYDQHVLTRRGDHSYNADAVEVFLAGPSAQGYNGPYDGQSDGGAMQFVLSPPSASDPEAQGSGWSNPPGQHNTAIFAPSNYAGRLVDDGYEFELRIPWHDAGPRASGARIAFNLAIDVQDDQDAGGRQLQAFLYLPNPIISGAEVCGFTNRAAEPYCDDRTWCTPELQ